MKKSGKIFRRLTVLLFTGLLSITFSAPREASAASAKYAAYSENNIYKVGKHRYKASVKNQGSRPKAMLYRKKKGKWKKLLTHQNTYGITVRPNMENGCIILFTPMIPISICIVLI